MARRGYGITLLEVLVTVGLIAFLAAILTPSLGRTKRSFKRTACLKNLKTIAMGLIIYADDNGGWLPPGIQRSDGGARVDLSPNILQHSGLGYDLGAMLRRYVQTDSLICPESHGERYFPVPADARIAYSNYLFAWGAIKETPVTGYRKLEDAPGWDLAAADLYWSIGRTYHFNHLRFAYGAIESRPFSAADVRDYAGKQYSSGSAKPIYGMNGCYYDGSAQWMDSERLMIPPGRALNQAGLSDSSTYIPARRRLQ